MAYLTDFEPDKRWMQMFPPKDYLVLPNISLLVPIIQITQSKANQTSARHSAGACLIFIEH
jgi:hypothetical protein